MQYSCILFRCCRFMKIGSKYLQHHEDYAFNTCKHNYPKSDKIFFLVIASLYASLSLRQLQTRERNKWQENYSKLCSVSNGSGSEKGWVICENVRIGLSSAMSVGNFVFDLGRSFCWLFSVPSVWKMLVKCF